MTYHIIPVLRNSPGLAVPSGLPHSPFRGILLLPAAHGPPRAGRRQQSIIASSSILLHPPLQQLRTHVLIAGTYINGSTGTYRVRTYSLDYWGTVRVQGSVVTCCGALYSLKPASRQAQRQLKPAPAPRINTSDALEREPGSTNEAD